MKTQQTKKDKQKKISKQRLNRRIFFVAILFIWCVGYIVYQVTYIKIVNGEAYQKEVYSRLLSRESRINPQRGNILDRNNKTLATSFLTYDITISPKEILEQDEEDIANLYQELSSALGIKVEDIKQMVEKSPSSQYAMLRKNVDSQVGEGLREKNLRGVWFDKSFIRNYPKGELAAQLIGFYNKNGEGQYGIEQQYNDYMLGIPGRIFSQFQDEQVITTEMKSVENGANIILTIDEVIQQYVEQTMKKYIDEFKPRHAAALVMNPNTGELYSMYSYPSFNPNQYNDLEKQLGKKEWAALSNEEKSEALNKAWKNFNTQNPYELGSTFKPLVVAMALDENAIEEHETYNCLGSKVVAAGVNPIHCWKTAGHGVQTLEQALANSCNVAMMDMAEKVNSATFLNYMSTYGFGQSTHIKLQGEETGLLHSKLGPVEKATYSIGQTFTATPVQLITAFSAVINGGYLLEPLVVSDIVDEKGDILYHAKPSVRRQIISKETSSKVKQYLQKVVDDGTGLSANISGYKIGGKTGTAETWPRGNDKYVLSFIGYAPVDTPEVITLIVFDDVPEKSGIPAKAFKEMMVNILPYLEIETTHDTQTADEETGKVPDVVHKDIYEASGLLSSEGLDYKIEGVGKKVVKQYPKAGTNLPKGSSVRLYVETDTPDQLIETPDLGGLSIEQAQALVGDLFMISGTGAGKIVKQTPKAGHKLEKNTEIIVQTSE